MFRCLIVFAAAFALRATACAANPEGPIRQIVSQLRRFQGDSGQGVNVPPAVAANLAALKRALRDLIVDVVAAPGAVKAAPEVLTARVIERLEREDVPVGDEGGFGAIPSIEFRQPREYPAWLIATTSLSIPCGLDTSLYLFEIQGSSWKHVLTVESNGYGKISGAQGWLTYYVAPPMPGRKPYLVTADITPWCSSVWQTLRVKVLRIGDRPETPVVLANRALDYCLDDTYHVSIRADGFGLIYLASAVDPELAGLRGVHYLEYAVGVRRASVVRDAAIDPYNVIARWACKDWPTASRSVAASARQDLRQWHEHFRSERWECGLSGLRVSHRPEGDHEQLLAVADCIRGEDIAASAHVVFAARRDGFHIASISHAKPALPESSGYSIYGAGRPGLTNPVLESAVRPKLPAGVPVSSTSPVRLQFAIVVNEDGSVNPSVRMRSWPSDESRIVVPAIQAVRQWKYKPGLKNGRPVKVSIDVEVVFER